MAHYAKRVNVNESPPKRVEEECKDKKDKVITVRLNPHHYSMLSKIAMGRYRTSNLSHSIRLMIEDTFVMMTKEQIEREKQVV